MVETQDGQRKNNRLLPLNPKRCGKDRMIYVKKRNVIDTTSSLHLRNYKILTNHIRLYLCDYMYTAIDNLKDKMASLSQQGIMMITI